MKYDNYIIYDSSKNLFFLGNLEVTGNLITSVEPVSSQLPPKGLIMPGFVNVHSHLGELPFRGGFFGKTLEQYLIDTEVENQFRNFESMRTEISELTLGEMISKGVTAISGARVGEAAEFWNIKSLSLYPLMNSNKLAHFLKQGPKGWNLEGYDGFFCHSLLTVNKETLEHLSSTLKGNPGLYLQIHVAETESGSMCVQKKYGMSEVELLDSLGLLGEKTILVHCTYCTEADMKLISSKKATVVICPVSNYRLGGKILDITNFINEINFCISTDGPGTNDSLDILAELKYMALLSGIEPKDLLPMVTINAAKALGYEQEIGSLEVGKQADLIIFAADTHFFPFRNLHNIVVLNPPTANIVTVMSRGAMIFQKNGGLNETFRIESVLKRVYKKYAKDNIN